MHQPFQRSQPTSACAGTGTRRRFVPRESQHALELFARHAGGEMTIGIAVERNTCSSRTGFPGFHGLFSHRANQPPGRSARYTALRDAVETISRLDVMKHTVAVGKVENCLRRFGRLLCSKLVLAVAEFICGRARSQLREGSKPKINSGCTISRSSGTAKPTPQPKSSTRRQLR